MNVEHTKGLREIPVKIKRLHPDAAIPKYATDLAAGFDLVAVDDVIIAPGETKLIPLGFAVEIPEGFEFQVRPRSGVTWKTKLRVGNSPGTVDGDFRGEVKVIVDNTAHLVTYGAVQYYETVDGSFADTEMMRICFSTVGSHDIYEECRKQVSKGTYIIRKGDRIAQGVIAPVYRADFIEVEELGETKRGDGGFGHTGV
ncbi:dUTP diphosphatase [Paenibacillus alvei]|uniref:dUTP diphosphatase n=1 Tax=Paenibacillus alvei TaxID=44250 RepID=UPI0018CE5195|nr:deoxyuridine 5'-triphosphate nucleotidohydrolase [Paenibacillus alvei]MBG9736452.1 hypothetical protein [Paenibacillus alvei]MBG9736482.1 hypothetical protein [Paenibacillus alvei]MBG9736518.1 hypothetical protein [Paenibacillus alvei]MBG9736593.1 hypothetical protein [Paenibacillus alvei]MBG9745577.1 hypothetical protein [Paenibacillus alvei]